MSQVEDIKIQEMLHDIEVGPLKKVFLLAGFFTIVVGLVSLYLILNFRGLDSETAMDQAQIGRQIASGNGFSTLYVRPMAMWQFLNEDKEIPSASFPDTYNFPLNPLVNAVVLRPFQRWWSMEPTDVVYIGDRVIASAGIAFFLSAVFIFFFVVRGLFDSKIAWITTCLVLLTDMMWRYSVSGLPQMLLLFLFAAALWGMHQAMIASEAKQLGRMLLLLSATAVCFGLMTLAQPLTSWIFLGFLIFVFSWFPQRAVSGLLVFFLYAAVVAPWIIRNYQVCGNPLGLGIFSILDGTVGTEFSFMSNLQPDLTAFALVKSKLRQGLTGQFQDIFNNLGYNLAGAAFFFALLHIFRNRVTNMLRWALILMWGSAALGMAFFSPRGEVSNNQLHLLFLPLFIAYGMAFLFVLWNRMDLRFPPAKIAFITIIFSISSLPMAVNLLTTPEIRVNWPPYVPTFINNVTDWMDQDEILCSDMPWATAWYGGQKSLLLPATIQQFISIHDYKYLGGPVNGLYLTPVSGNRPFLSQIAKGEYGDWGSFIMRTADLTNFPLEFFTPLPMDNECVFYSNRDRWSATDQL